MLRPTEPDWGGTESPEWWEGQEYSEAGRLEEAQGGGGCAWHAADVEQMSFAQRKELSLRAQTPLEPHKLRSPASLPRAFRKMRSEGLS